MKARGKNSRETADGIISRLQDAWPAELPWGEVTHLAELATAGVQHPNADSLDHLSHAWS